MGLRLMGMQQLEGCKKGPLHWEAAPSCGA
jgi:hypothetical protein